MGRDIGRLSKDLFFGTTKLAVAAAGLYATAEYGPDIFRSFRDGIMVPDIIVFTIKYAMGVGIPAAMGGVSLAVGYNGIQNYRGKGYVLREAIEVVNETIEMNRKIKEYRCSHSGEEGE